jgi:hypothetical protein
MIPLTLFHQKPYQKGVMSLNTHGKYTLGDIDSISFSIWREVLVILFAWKGNSSCRGDVTVALMINA